MIRPVQKETIMSTPTQVRRPWRATARTLFAAVVALAAMLPLLVQASGLDDTWAPVAGALAIAGAITRIMALPVVEDFLARFVPWLAAEPPVRVAPAGFLDTPMPVPAPPLVASVVCHICAPGAQRFELPITTNLYGFTTVTDLGEITVTAPTGDQAFRDHMEQHRSDGTFAAKLLEHAESMGARADTIRRYQAGE
ncbi:hypothetical protein SAMN05421671_3140 [Pimelobacter simplex]|nr:hypothetical protein SAMN05421671_3140 [Pimelobacter simplex]